MSEIEEAKAAIAQAVNDASAKLASDASAAVKVISDATEQAAKVLARTTEESLRIQNTNVASDHDLLIELKTLMGGVKNDISDLKTNTTNRIDALERDKAEKKDFEEYKKTNDTVVLGLATTKSNQTILLSIGIGMLLLLTGMVIYHLFGIKI